MYRTIPLELAPKKKKKKMPLENDHHMIKVETKRKKKERRYQMLYIFHTYAPWFFVVGLLSLSSSIPIVLLYLHDSWILLISLMDYMDLKKKRVALYLFFTLCLENHTLIFQNNVLYMKIILNYENEQNIQIWGNYIFLP